MQMRRNRRAFGENGWKLNFSPSFHIRRDAFPLFHPFL
jgi:hypothetical protein